MTGCCGWISNGSSGGGGAPVSPVIYELNFASLATVDPLPTGAQVIDGSTWTSQFQGTTFRILNGAGLQFAANLVSTAYTSTSQTAAFLELPMSTLYSRFMLDAASELVFEIYISQLTSPAPNDEVVLAIRGNSGSPANSANRMAAAVRGNRALAQVALGRNDGTSSSNYTTNAAALNVLGVRTHGESADAFAGVWAAGWSPLEYHLSRPKGAGTASASSRDRLGFLGIAFATGNIAGGMTATVERLRVRRAA